MSFMSFVNFSQFNLVFHEFRNCLPSISIIINVLLFVNIFFVSATYFKEIIGTIAKKLHVYSI